MENKKSIFETLSSLDIKPLTQKKGNYDYLSWSNAVRVMLKEYPLATWEFSKWNDMPYLKTEVGYFVECSVTIDGLKRTQLMPILDFNNRAVLIGKLTSDQVNKAQMRSLAKAIALHGVGLDLWAGEDLMPTQEELELATRRAKLTRTDLAAFISEKGYTVEGVCKSFGVESIGDLDIKTTFDTVLIWSQQQ